MPIEPFTAEGAAFAVLALSKAAWKAASSLPKLDQDAENADATTKTAVAEVKSLGNECDLVYAELEEVVRKRETGSPQHLDVDSRIWTCLATQVEESNRTIQELQLFIQSVKGEESSPIVQAQRQRKLDKRKDQIASIRTKVRRQTENMRTTLLLINATAAHILPGRPNQRLTKGLEKLQDVVEQLQKSQVKAQSRSSSIEATLLQCAREIAAKGSTMYEASLAVEPIVGSQGTASSNIRVAEWVSTLDSIRRDQRLSDPSDIVSSVPSVFSGDEAHTGVTSASSAQHTVQEGESVDAVTDDSEDDLDIDLAKAALDTGTNAFEVQEWVEADSLLQEALRVLQQLPKRQRAFCDIFGLQYKLAVCAYHTQEPADSEEALMSLVQQPASSDEQRGYIHNAAHLLSLLYIRMSQIDRAKSECEKALQVRRRLLGKRSDLALESTALMAHIYVLLNNRPRAKACLAMIPAERRDAVLKIVEESLGGKVGYLDSSSLMSRSVSEDSDLVVKRIQGGLSEPALALPMENRCYGPVSQMISQSPAASPWQSDQRIPSSKVGVEDLQSVTVTSLSSAEERNDCRTTEKERTKDENPADPEVLGATAMSPGEYPAAIQTLKSKTLSRKEILEKIGCQPRDRIEEAVCDGDHSAFASLLNKKMDSWRSRFHKRIRPERVTALHFAALFGEIDMARRLLGSGYDINEVPYGYTTRHTPLKFAIGARQVHMVEFLIANGARPSEPDSWSTLAGQLMNRSWLMKTMSEAEKEVMGYVPNRMIAILRILLKHRWDLNLPYEMTGRTVLHQAVTFWTGSYNWDLNVRAAMTSFLYEQGADHFQADKEGKTPYEMAFTSGHQDLLLILGRDSKEEPDYRPAQPVELSGTYG